MSLLGCFFLEDGNWQTGVRMGEVMLDSWRLQSKKMVGQISVVLHGHAIP